MKALGFRLLPGLLIIVSILTFYRCADQLTGPEMEVTEQQSGLLKPDLPDVLIRVPDDWNGELVVFAHGYVSPNAPLEAWRSQLIIDGETGETLDDLVVNQGYAFAGTSFERNGLIIPEAVANLIELVGLFENQHGEPDVVYIAGASEGGLITALAVEQHPEVFDGGLATCGPIGNFRKQLHYFGDFNVVFNYYFPYVLVPFGGPPKPDGVNDTLIAAWEADDLGSPVGPKDAVVGALIANPGKTQKLLSVTRAPVGTGDQETVAETILGILFYNIVGTNNAIDVLDGKPFDNTRRWYSGTGSFWEDLRLNRGVERYAADAIALTEIEDNYQTAGALKVPLVTMHTTDDPIVPYWHEPMYTLKTFATRSALFHRNIPVYRYGHCNFTQEEILHAFEVLVRRVKIQRALASL